MELWQKRGGELVGFSYANLEKMQFMSEWDIINPGAGGGV